MIDGLYGLKVSRNMRQTACLCALAADAERPGGLGRPVPGVAIGFGYHGGIAAIHGRELEATGRGLQVCFAQGSFPLAARRREVGSASVR